MLAKLMPACALVGFGLMAIRAGRRIAPDFDPAEPYDRKRRARRRVLIGFGALVTVLGCALAAVAVARND